jgi:hypothetical protein
VLQRRVGSSLGPDTRHYACQLTAEGNCPDVRSLCPTLYVRPRIAFSTQGAVAVVGPRARVARLQGDEPVVAVGSAGFELTTRGRPDPAPMSLRRRSARRPGDMVTGRHGRATSC